jgi:acyl-CoA synthetase (AMP-forming)/AMP-acid ligase II
LWALIVSRSPLDDAALRTHCQQRLSPLFCPVRFVSLDRLPRNENGKLDRSRLRDLAVGPEIER